VETPAAVAAPAAAPVEALPATDQVVRAARIVVSDGLTHMEVRLEPPSLGAVRIMATAGADRLGLTIVAERPETRALLMHAIPEMQAALAGHGTTTPSISIAATFEPPTERRAPTRRDPDRPSRDTRGFSDRRSSSRAEQSVTAVDLTV